MGGPGASSSRTSSTKNDCGCGLPSSSLERTRQHEQPLGPRAADVEEVALAIEPVLAHGQAQPARRGKRAAVLVGQERLRRGAARELALLEAADEDGLEAPRPDRLRAGHLHAVGLGGSPRRTSQLGQHVQHAPGLEARARVGLHHRAQLGQRLARGHVHARVVELRAGEHRRAALVGIGEQAPELALELGQEARRPVADRAEAVEVVERPALGLPERAGRLGRVGAGAPDLQLQPVGQAGLVEQARGAQPGEQVVGAGLRRLGGAAHERHQPAAQAGVSQRARGGRSRRGCRRRRTPVRAASRSRPAGAARPRCRPARSRRAAARAGGRRAARPRPGGRRPRGRPPPRRPPPARRRRARRGGAPRGAGRRASPAHSGRRARAGLARSRRCHAAPGRRWRWPGTPCGRARRAARRSRRPRSGPRSSRARRAGADRSRRSRRRTPAWRPSARARGAARRGHARRTAPGRRARPTRARRGSRGRSRPPPRRSARRGPSPAQSRSARVKRAGSTIERPSSATKRAAACTKPGCAADSASTPSSARRTAPSTISSRWMSEATRAEWPARRAISR